LARDLNPAAGLGDEFLGLGKTCFIQVRAENEGAAACKGAGSLPPDARASARDQHDFSFEIIRHDSLLFDSGRMATNVIRVREAGASRNRH
jgi:hypothetical protein